jgi:hypothetical protein
MTPDSPAQSYQSSSINVHDSRLRIHWEDVYSTSGETGVSWYPAEPALSLELIGAVAPAEAGRIIDVGGGASVLVDRLLDRHYAKIAVLDSSSTGCSGARTPDIGDKLHLNIGAY